MPREYTHTLDQLLNRPLLVTPARAQVVFAYLAERSGHTYEIQTASHITDAETAAAASKQAKSTLAPSQREQGRKLFPLVEGVAIIEASGTLVNKCGLEPWSGMTGYDGLAAKLSAAVSDPDVKGILFDIDSPGGEVAGCFDLADQIRNARNEKPVWAVATDVAYSAAYALAASADKFFLPRTGGAGSIGVVCMHVDISALLEKEGYTVTLIHAGEHKVEGNPYEPLPEAIAGEIQAELETVRGIFADTVAAGRNVSKASVLATEAAVYLGAEAVAAGLADGVMAPTDVLAAFIDTVNQSTLTNHTPTIAAGLRPAPDASRKDTAMPAKATAKPGLKAAEDDNKSAEDEEKPAEAEKDADKKEAADGEPDGDENEAEKDGDKKEAADGEPDGDEKESEKDGPDSDKDKNATVSVASAKAILALPQAANFGKLASELAFEPGMTAQRAKTLLTAAAQGGKAGTSLSDAMATIENADVSASGGGGADAGSADAVAARVVGNFQRAKGLNPSAV